MSNKQGPYIRLSRIRDYGIGKEEGDFVLCMSELEGLDDNQLRGLKKILEEEINDIDYQIAREQKHLEHDLKWHYGAKSSKRARADFICEIDKLLVGTPSDELTKLRAFHKAARQILDKVDPSLMPRIEQAVSDACSPKSSGVFDVSDV